MNVYRRIMLKVCLPPMRGVWWQMGVVKEGIWERCVRKINNARRILICALRQPFPRYIASTDRPLIPYLLVR